VNGDAIVTAADAIMEAAARMAGAGESGPRAARDPVNLPMIRNWAEAIGDANPVYTDAEAAARSVHGRLVAPPAMAQVWTMRGLHPSGEPDDDPLGLMSEVLDEAGFTSVVATNCEQEYYRYLRHGEQVTVRARLESVTGPKQTSLGEGWFVTTRSTWCVGDEPVASMMFRILKFRPPVPAAAPGRPDPAPPVPAAAPVSPVPGAAPVSPDPSPPAPGAVPVSPDPSPPVPGAVPVSPDPSPPAPGAAGDVLRPVVSRDTAFFWDGTAAGDLRIQRCGDCGALRHPPGPMCPACGAGRPGYLVAAGTGEVYSYVVQHHPPVPGKQLPIVVALVQLTEGVRMVGELLGVSPDRVRIGLPVRVEFVRVDDTLTLPAWREDTR
jgi:uncharacterized protein